MSLKAFHLIFISAASALALGFGVWSLHNYHGADGRTKDLIYALGSFAGGGALIVYERYFLKKTRRIGYL